MATGVLNGAAQKEIILKSLRENLEQNKNFAKMIEFTSAEKFKETMREIQINESFISLAKNDFYWDMKKYHARMDVIRSGILAKIKSSQGEELTRWKDIEFEHNLWHCCWSFVPECSYSSQEYRNFSGLGEYVARMEELLA